MGSCFAEHLSVRQLACGASANHYHASMERLTQQLAFVLELDKLKTVLRHTELADSSRRENTAEHSWHAALMALLLAEHANEPIDASKAAKMLLVHDVVEIDAGDTLLYDEKGNIDKQEREQKAADRLFGLLPPDQAQELRAVWDEFEAAESPEAKYAHAIDRFAPCMLNLASNGSAWAKNGIRYEQAYAKNAKIGDGSLVLWEQAQTILKRARIEGFLK